MSHEFRLRILALAALVACGGSTVTDTPGPGTTPVDTTKPPVTVQRASITVKVAIDPGDAAIAATAGISASGVAVHLLRTGAGAQQTAIAGPDGSVRFDNLLEGLYEVSVDRSLSTAETAKLAPADREVTIFAGGGNVVLSPPVNKELTVSLVGARRGSIVISEIFAYNGPLVFTGTQYGFGTYIEVYNNSDTTAYLDGMLWLTMGGTLSDYSPRYPCNQFPQNMRMDSTALYAALILAFPGSGREYPIRPGEAKVVAMDAIDHRAAAPEKQQVDLSHAHFEQYFSDADTDNPESANIVRVYTGSSGSLGIFGRGFPVNSGRRIYTLMQPAARAAMTLTQFPNTAGATGVGDLYDLYRIPSEYLIDAVGLEYAPTIYGYPPSSPACSPWSAYERAPAPLVDDNYRKAIARKSLGRTSDGREILQRTRASARDFEYVDPLRRSLDK